MTTWDESTVKIRAKAQPRPELEECSLCAGSGPRDCVGCGGERLVRMRPAVIDTRIRPKAKAKKPQAPKPSTEKLYPVRPFGRDGRPVPDDVFLALNELGWCRLVPFDDDAHYAQLEML